MNFVLGQKLEMTQTFSVLGDFIPVTKIKVEPNTILRIKDQKKDGYTAVVLGFKNKNKVKKSLMGVFKNFGKFRYVKEFRIDEEMSLKPGDKIGLNSFQVGERVKVSSISKGKGFQGVVKRYGFRGSKATHGNKDQARMPGSIGATAPAHVFKGTRMGGRMGGNRVTISNLEIVKIDLENNILYIKGAFAGARNALVYIQGQGELKVYQKTEETKESTSTASSDKSSSFNKSSEDKLEAKKVSSFVKTSEDKSEVKKATEDKETKEFKDKKIEK